MSAEIMKGVIPMHKYVYLFTEGNGSMRELLGGKGANLAEMTNIGLPVPQGFTISTEACTQYYEDGRQINADIQARAPERTETSRGFSLSPNFLPVMASSLSTYSMISAWMSSLIFRPSS